MSSQNAINAYVDVSVCVPTLDATSQRLHDLLCSIDLDVPYETIIVENSWPQGVTDPINSALRAARGDYLVVVGDDVTFLDGWWPPMRSELDAGAAVAYPLTVEGFMRYDFAAWCFAMSRKSMQMFSYLPGTFFDPQMKIWYQDTDLLRRLERCGCPPVHVAESRIRHGLSRTIGTSDRAPWVQEQIDKDERVYHEKWG